MDSMCGKTKKLTLVQTFRLKNDVTQVLTNAPFFPGLTPGYHIAFCCLVCTVLEEILLRWGVCPCRLAPWRQAWAPGAEGWGQGHSVWCLRSPPAYRQPEHPSPQLLAWVACSLLLVVKPPKPVCCGSCSFYLELSGWSNEVPGSHLR